MVGMPMKRTSEIKSKAISNGETVAAHTISTFSDNSLAGKQFCGFQVGGLVADPHLPMVVSQAYISSTKAQIVIYNPNEVDKTVGTITVYYRD